MTGILMLIFPGCANRHVAPVHSTVIYKPRQRPYIKRVRTHRHRHNIYNGHDRRYHHRKKPRRHYYKKHKRKRRRGISKKKHTARPRRIIIKRIIKKRTKPKAKTRGKRRHKRKAYKRRRRN